MHDIFFGKNKLLKINFQYFKIYMYFVMEL
jgi:hypothetical protein